MIELYKMNNVHTIKIFYKNSTEEILSPLNIPNCGSVCPLNKMFEIYKDILPDNDFETECRVNITEEKNLFFAGT